MSCDPNAVLVVGGSAPLAGYVVDALAERAPRVVGYGDTAGQLFDLPRLLQVMRGHAVDRIVHAADVANVQGVLEAARLAAVRGRIVLLSSIAVYGDNDGPIDESSPLRPRTPYAVAKVTGEQLGRIYRDLYGLDVVVLRVGDAYGAALESPTLVRRLMHAAVDRTPFRSPNGGDHTFHL